MIDADTLRDELTSRFPEVSEQISRIADDGYVSPYDLLTDVLVDGLLKAAIARHDDEAQLQIAEFLDEILQGGDDWLEQITRGQTLLRIVRLGFREAILVHAGPVVAEALSEIPGGIPEPRAAARVEFAAYLLDTRALIGVRAMATEHGWRYCDGIVLEAGQGARRLARSLARLCDVAPDPSRHGEVATWLAAAVESVSPVLTVTDRGTGLPWRATFGPPWVQLDVPRGDLRTLARLLIEACAAGG